MVGLGRTYYSTFRVLAVSWRAMALEPLVRIISRTQ